MTDHLIDMGRGERRRSGGDGNRMEPTFIESALAQRVVALEAALRELADAFVDLHTRQFPNMNVTKHKRYADARALLANAPKPEGT